MAKPLFSGLIESLELPDTEVFTAKLPFVKHAVSVIDAIGGIDEDLSGFNQSHFEYPFARFRLSEIGRNPSERQQAFGG